MDACDQSDVECPHFGGTNRPKDWEGANKLNIKMGAVLFHGGEHKPPYGYKPALYLFPVDQRTKKDANFWCTSLCSAISDYRDNVRGGTLPPVLYVQVDSASDNKNWTVSGFTEWLVRARIFSRVKVSFLPVGHTHEDIDAAFGRLSQTMHRLLTDLPELRGGVVSTWADCLLAARKSSSFTQSITPVYVSQRLARRVAMLAVKL
jgi:hypothetical protein